MAEKKLQAMRAANETERDPVRMLASGDVLKPKAGDVVIERGARRDESSGRIASRSVQTERGPTTDVEEGYVTYRFETRPDKHPVWGRWCHRDDGVDYIAVLTQTPPMPGGENPYFGTDPNEFEFDAEGFLLDPEDGNRISRFADDNAFIPHGFDSGVDDAALNKAKARLSKL